MKILQNEKTEILVSLLNHSGLTRGKLTTLLPDASLPSYALSILRSRSERTLLYKHPVFVNDDALLTHLPSTQHNQKKVM